MREKIKLLLKSKELEIKEARDKVTKERTANKKYLIEYTRDKVKHRRGWATSSTALPRKPIIMNIGPQDRDSKGRFILTLHKPIKTD